MTKCLFWNLNRKPLESAIAEIVHARQIDLILLAECGDIRAVRRELGRKLPSVPFEMPTRFVDRPVVEILVRNTAKFWVPRRDLKNCVVGQFRPPLGEEFSIFAVHLPSQQRGISQPAGSCQILANEIRDVESECGHERTVLVGDLNLDPFDVPVVEAHGLHAVMSRRIARRGARTVEGKTYPFFYNPMWEILGRNEELPPGTYYYNRGGYQVRFWHAFDQVLVRPALLDRFPHGSVEVVHDTGRRSLLNRHGQPDAEQSSDHLPIAFTITEQNVQQRSDGPLAERHVFDDSPSSSHTAKGAGGVAHGEVLPVDMRKGAE